MSVVRVPLASRSERAFPPPLRGRVEFTEFESQVLRGNPLGDPVRRDLAVYLPPSGRTEGIPLLLLLTGFTGSGWLHFPRKGRYLSEPLASQFERLQRAANCPEAVIVAPDCVTTLGGSQYLNSAATGRYEDYVMSEILPWVRRQYHTGPTGVLGHSSGGYGALVLGMRHPDQFQAVLASAADADFELCYQMDIPNAVRVFREKGGPEKLLEEILFAPPPLFTPSHPYAQAVNLLAMASCYSPVEGQEGPFELPFEWQTGELRPEVWARWQAWDPLRMMERPEYERALAGMRSIVIGSGNSDEYGLDLAGHQLVARLRSMGLTRVEEHSFPGRHGETWGPLMEAALPGFVRALQQ